jgi:hypothetical protein
VCCRDPCRDRARPSSPSSLPRPTDSSLTLCQPIPVPSPVTLLVFTTPRSLPCLSIRTPTTLVHHLDTRVCRYIPLASPGERGKLQTFQALVNAKRFAPAVPGIVERVHAACIETFGGPIAAPLRPLHQQHSTYPLVACHPHAITSKRSRAAPACVPEPVTKPASLPQHFECVYLALPRPRVQHLGCSIVETTRADCHRLCRSSRQIPQSTSTIDPSPITSSSCSPSDLCLLLRPPPHY